MSILAIGAAYATFVENDYGFETAKVLVYNAKWYEAVLILTAINMAGVMYKYKMWKHRGRFLLHFAFLVILLGAGLTRYFGYEGIMHIREGQATAKMISYEPYLQVEVTKGGETYYS
ncbi:MAG: cytochrome c biogenesis protein ResB, partial [Campylobacterota bacterium]